MSLFGAPVLRKEDGRLLRGRGRYVSDVDLPRMLHVAFVRSVHAHARLDRIDTAAAMAAAGVVLAVTGAEPPIARCRLRAPSALPTYVETDQPVLAWPRVRFCGEAVAAVVAADRYLAEDAAGLVAVEYDPLPAVVDVGEARGSAAIVHDGAPDNVLLSRRFDHGDVDSALASSAVVVERVFFQTNVRTAMSVGQASGIVMAEAINAGCEVAQYGPNEVKSSGSVTRFPSETSRATSAISSSADRFSVCVMDTSKGDSSRDQGD